MYVDSRLGYPQKLRRPRVAHFCGRRGSSLTGKVIRAPFTIAWLEHHRSQQVELGAWLAVLNEEQYVLADKFWRRFNALLGNRSRGRKKKSI